MNEALVEQLCKNVKEAAELYHRLILLVGPAGSGKTTALQQAATKLAAPLVNVNLELSRRLLDLPERQRPLEVRNLLRDVLGEANGEIVLFDNIELLFDVNLKQDPLRLLESLSRNRTVVAAWNGSVSDGHVTYAAPDHPEYRRYPVEGFLVASAETAR